MKNIKDLLALKCPYSRLMGFDIGDKRVGVSVSDSSWTVASPVGYIDRTKNWEQALRQMIALFPLHRPSGHPANTQNHAIVGFVVGLPYLLNGDLGPQAQKVQNFCEKHLELLNIPLFYWDERFSTFGANRILLEANVSRAKRKTTIDKMSATFILQGVLDSLKMT